MEFFDVHAHCIRGQRGGILIGLEGEPHFDSTMTNVDVEKATANNNNFVGAYYIDRHFGMVKDEKILKYHPRREQYTAEQVMDDLKKRACKLCIIDTLNQPNWQPLDYWKVIIANKNITFLLSHVGGYDIIDFLKILDFNKNVYVDFSMTQEYFGWCGNRARLGVVADGIDFCLNSQKLSTHVLFGSDEPFFSQQVAYEKYLTYKSAENVLINNYIELMSKIN